MFLFLLVRVSSATYIRRFVCFLFCDDVCILSEEIETFQREGYGRQLTMMYWCRRVSYPLAESAVCCNIARVLPNDEKSWRTAVAALNGCMCRRLPDRDALSAVRGILFLFIPAQRSNR